MPVEKLPNGKYRWGKHGHEYASRAGAEAQARAAYANGYREDMLRVKARPLKASPRAEVRYVLDLQQIMGGLHGAAEHIIRRELGATRAGDLHQDGPIDDARRRLAMLWDQIKGWIRMHVGNAYDRMADEVQKRTAAGHKEFGIPILQVPGMAKVIDDARTRNIALITNASQDFLQQVREVLEEYAHLEAAPGAGGQRLQALTEPANENEGPGIGEVGGGELPPMPRTIAEALQARVGVSKSRAQLIARDQTLKLNSAITKARQTAAGVQRYTWSTSMDERVRPSHRLLDGQVFDWDDPPVTNDAGDRNHPGQDYQCRCLPVPYIDELEGTGQAATAPEEPDEESEQLPEAAE